MLKEFKVTYGVECVSTGLVYNSMCQDYAGLTCIGSTCQ